MSKFIIKKAKTGLMFNFVASNGEVVATSEVYTTKKACKKYLTENLKTICRIPKANTFLPKRLFGKMKCKTVFRKTILRTGFRR